MSTATNIRNLLRGSQLLRGCVPSSSRSNGVATQPVPATGVDANLAVPVVTSLDISAGLTDDQKEFQSLAINFANNEVG